MLPGGSVMHVTCEHIEDVVVARGGDPRCVDGGAFWDFQQIKTGAAVEPWTLSDVLARKAALCNDQVCHRCVTASPSASPSASRPACVGSMPPNPIQE
ncbi:hypothetical protein [Streptomyces zaomyceticus]|uniref:hypothetical protein n=1 Tax=Streptomyces zaomyceticus TaxID=68286 RepID=UPI0036866019